jgi:hypothetical protein
MRVKQMFLLFFCNFLYCYSDFKFSCSNGTVDQIKTNLSRRMNMIGI